MLKYPISFIERMLPLLFFPIEFIAMNTDQNVSVVSSVMPVIDRHSKIEDGLAMLIGTFILSFAMMLLQQAGIMTGGTAGLSLLIHYITDLKFGILFFLINIPFSLYTTKIDNSLK